MIWVSIYIIFAGFFILLERRYYPNREVKKTIKDAALWPVALVIILVEYFLYYLEQLISKFK